MAALEGRPEEDQIEMWEARKPGELSCLRVKDRSVRKRVVAPCQMAAVKTLDEGQGMPLD